MRAKCLHLFQVRAKCSVGERSDGDIVFDSEEWGEGSLVFRLRALPAGECAGIERAFRQPVAAVAFRTGKPQPIGRTSGWHAVENLSRLQHPR